jgi:hypothetical protein
VSEWVSEVVASERVRASAFKRAHACGVPDMYIGRAGRLMHDAKRTRLRRMPVARP